MILFVLDLMVALPCILLLLNAKASTSRGTNTVTRFVRDVSSYRKYSNVGRLTIGISVMMLVLGTLFKSWYACIPTALCAGLTYYLKMKSNTSEQRATDARNVTKGTMQVAGESGDVLGSAAGIAISAVSGGTVPPMVAINAGKTIGGSAGKGLLKAADSMTDCTADLQGCGIKDVEAFKLAASRAGISTEGKDVIEVAENVVKFAPTTALKALPDNMSTEDKAVRILGGEY